MEEFVVVLSGKRGKDSFYIKLEKEEEDTGATLIAFIQVKELKEKGSTILLKASRIPWTY